MDHLLSKETDVGDTSRKVLYGESYLVLRDQTLVKSKKGL